MKPTHLLAGLCVTVLGAVPAALPSRAQTAPVSASAPAAVASGGPAAPITALYDRITQIEHSQGSFAERARILQPAVDEAFDLPVVLRNSLGLRYRTVPEVQKQALLDQFRQFTVARYVSNFAPGGTDRFTVDPVSTPSAIPGDQIVHSRIASGGATTEINYAMRPGPAGWRIVDVLLNGNISQVAVQRADFGSSLTSGDATSLIDSLRKKTQAFSEN